MVYLLILLFSYVLWFLIFELKYYKINENSKKLLFLLPITILCIWVMGFRGLHVGVDTSNYYRIYNYIAHYPNFNLLYLSKTLDVEWGFVLYCKFISLIFNDYIYFQVINAIIICSGLSRFIFYKSKNVFVSFLILYTMMYLWGFNITRQVLSSVFIINGWIFLTNKKYFLSFFHLLIAFLFHSTAILSVVIVFLWFIRKTDFIKVFPLLLIIFIISFNIIVELVSQLNIYVNYFNQSKTIQSAGYIFIIWGIILITSLITDFKKSPFDEKFYATCALIYVTANICGLEFNYFERLGIYFYPFVSLSLPCYSKLIRKKNFRLIYLICLSLGYSVYYLMSVKGQYEYSFY